MISLMLIQCTFLAASLSMSNGCLSKNLFNVALYIPPMGLNVGFFIIHLFFSMLKGSKVSHVPLCVHIWLPTSTAFPIFWSGYCVYRFNILLGGCGICIDLKFSEAISRSCVLCCSLASMKGRKLGKGSGGHMEADWDSWGSFISRLLGSNISEAVKGVEIYHVTNMPSTTNALCSVGLVI